MIGLSRSCKFSEFLIISSYILVEFIDTLESQGHRDCMVIITTNLIDFHVNVMLIQREEIPGSS